MICRVLSAPISSSDCSGFFCPSTQRKQLGKQPHSNSLTGETDTSQATFSLALFLSLSSNREQFQVFNNFNMLQALHRKFHDRGKNSGPHALHFYRYRLLQVLLEAGQCTVYTNQLLMRLGLAQPAMNFECHFHLYTISHNHC